LTPNCIPRYFANYVPKFQNIKVEKDKDRFFPFEKYPDFFLSIKKKKGTRFVERAGK